MKGKYLLIGLVACLLLSACDSATQTSVSKDGSTSVTEAQVSTKFIDPKHYTGPLFPAIKDGKYGFIDTNGSFVISPSFTYAKEFSEGMAPVYVGGQSFISSYQDSQYISYEGGKWGFIDRTGAIKISPQFGDVQQFSEGLALVTVGNGREGEAGYIDLNGLFKFAPKFDFDSSSPFKNGIAAVRFKNVMKPIYKDGDFVDSLGKKIPEAQALLLVNEYARLMKGHWINVSGEEIDESTALKLINLDRIVFEKKNIVQILGKNIEVTQYGIRDKKGKVVVAAKYDSLDDFYGKQTLETYKYTVSCKATSWNLVARNYALIKSAKCGLIDTEGNVVAPFDFDKMHRRSSDLATFGIGCDEALWNGCRPKKQGIYSVKERKIIVNPQFDNAFVLEDHIIVSVDGKYGYMDVGGKYTLEPKFSRARPFKDGLAQVDFPPNYIDKSGKYVYRGSIGPLQPKAKVASAPASVSSTAAAGGTPTKKGAGTAFVVNKEGYAITNHHVVDGCTELRIEGREGPVKRVTEDAVNDLALVKMSGDFQSSAPIASDPTKLRQGEDIVVFGFPLNSVLSSGGNLTPGVVSALTGLGNNTNQIQITAPIQPGSSGSPVITKKGEVVGVVSMKLSDSKMAKATGQIGQNVNFAVNGQTLRSFLDAHKVDYRSGSGFISFDKSTADLADEARKWTLILECWK